MYQLFLYSFLLLFLQGSCGTLLEIDFTNSTGTSLFSPGLSVVNYEFDYPRTGNDKDSIERANSLYCNNTFGFTNVHIMGWSADDPWPDPTSSEPFNTTYGFGVIEKRVNMALRCNSTPVITLCSAPWWMKGRLYANGTYLYTAAEKWELNSGRVRNDRIPQWLLLVQRIAERYMAPPYNVRHFQVWNEFKGYYNPMKNNWDHDNSSGEFLPNATHGYTYFYTQTYHRLMQVAANLSIPLEEVKIGGPYIVMDSWGGNSGQLGPSFKWGRLDSRVAAAIKYWLLNKPGSGFLTVDGGNWNNRDNIGSADNFTFAEKYHDLNNWIRNQTGGESLPLWWAEWYCYSRPNTSSATIPFNNAIKAYALMKILHQGVETMLSWAAADYLATDAGLWTLPTAVDGAAPLPFYYTLKAIRTHFGKGTVLYHVDINSTDIFAVASNSTIMIVNKTPNVQYIEVKDKFTMELEGYQVYWTDITSSESSSESSTIDSSSNSEASDSDSSSSSDSDTFSRSNDTSTKEPSSTSNEENTGCALTVFSTLLLTCLFLSV